MAFSMNYWQITASHVQRPAQRPPAPQPKGSESPMPVAPLPVRPEAPTADERHRALPYTPIYRETAQSTSTGNLAQAPAHGKPDGYTPTMADKVVRMMQASPNLTLAQVKAILKVDSFD